MNYLKKNLPIVLVTVAATLFLVAIVLLITNNRFTFNNKTKSNDKENSNVIEKKKDIIDDNKKEEIQNNDVNNENIEIKDNTNVNTNTSNNKAEVKESVDTYLSDINSEESLISYFEKTEESINSSNFGDQTISQRVKTGFVNIIDFIFYDKEIKGYTFKGLTNSLKLKVISIALKLDSKIDSYIPGYKDTISEKYRSLKEKLASLYATYTLDLCEKVGEDTCNQFKQDFSNMKTSFGITGDYLKDGWESLKSYIKDSYENWSDK